MTYIFYLYNDQDTLVGTRLLETDSPKREARKMRRDGVKRVEWEEA